MSKWTNRHVEALRALGGKTLKEIVEGMHAHRPMISEGTARSACIRYGVEYVPAPTSWPKEHVEALRKLAGSTGTQMMKAMRELRPDITRNSVVGAAHRYGVPLSDQTSNHGVEKTVKARAAARKPAPKVKAAPIRPKTGKNGQPRHADNPPPPDHGNPDKWRPLPGVNPVSLLERGSMQCAWPVDTDAPVQMFCGAECQDTKRPYCAQHRRDRLARYVSPFLRDAEKAAA